MAFKSSRRGIQSWRRRMDLVMGGLGETYIEKVLGYGPIAYWPLYETAGATAACLVNAAQNGTYTGVTLANGTAPDGSPCPFFDGANDYVDIFSAAFDTAFNRDEGTLMIWGQMFNLGVWTDGSVRTWLYLRSNASNYFRVSKPVNNRVSWLRRAAAGSIGVNRNGETSIQWMHLALTWSVAGNEMRAYFNGVLEGAPVAGLAAWTGGGLNNTQTVIGAESTVPIQIVHGWIAHCAIFDSVLTGAQILDLATV